DPRAEQAELLARDLSEEFGIPERAGYLDDIALTDGIVAVVAGRDVLRVSGRWRQQGSGEDRAARCSPQPRPAGKKSHCYTASMLAALARLLPYLGRVRRSLVLGLACILVATALSLTSPWLLKLAIDGLLAGDDRIRLGLLAAGIVGLAAADGVFRYLMRTLLIGASRQMEYDLRQDFFAHLQRLPPAYFQAHRTGDLMSRATNDLAAVRDRK